MPRKVTTPVKASPQRDIYNDLRGRIESGERKIGDLLPTEDQLCIEYQASRYALRRALAQLERDGLIERRRRAGTRVIAQKTDNVYRHAVGTRSDLLSFVSGTSVSFEPPKLVETDGSLARLLGCDEMRRWTLLEGVRIDSATGRPIGVTHVYIDAARITVEPDISLGSHAVYQWIEETHGIRVSAVSQDVSAVLLTEQEASLLGDLPRSPALNIIRRYFDEQQRIFMIAFTTHRSADFIYNIRLRFDQ